MCRDMQLLASGVAAVMHGPTDHRSQSECIVRLESAEKGPSGCLNQRPVVEVVFRLSDAMQLAKWPHL